MKTIRKFLPIISVVVLCFSLIFSVALAAPTFAADENNDAISTTFFGDFKDDGKGCGVYMVLNYALDILSWGIGIAAIVGIIVSGILYLTAKGNENQVIKSKKRILDIVIGVAIYAVLYAGLNFLLPGGKLNTNVKCTATTVSSNYGHTNEWRTKVSDQNNGARKIGPGGGESSSSPSNIKNVCNAPSQCTWSERIAQTAELLAWPNKTPKSLYLKTMYPRTKCFKSWSQLTKGHPTKAFQQAYDKVRPDHWKHCTKKWGNGIALGASCDVFAGTVVRYSGYDKKIPFGLNGQIPHLKKSSKWKKVSSPKRGDFCNRNGHSSIYIGNGKVAQAHYNSQSVGGKAFGRIEKGKCGGMRIYRVTQ